MENNEKMISIVIVLGAALVGLIVLFIMIAWRNRVNNYIKYAAWALLNNDLPRAKEYCKKYPSIINGMSPYMKDFVANEAYQLLQDNNDYDFVQAYNNAINDKDVPSTDLQFALLEGFKSGLLRYVKKDKPETLDALTRIYHWAYGNGYTKFCNYLHNTLIYEGIVLVKKEVVV